MTTPTNQPLSLDDLLLRPDIQSSLVTIVEGLPHLATLVSVLSKACEVSKEALSDGEMWGALDELVQKNVGGRISSCRELVKEARQRADANCRNTIGLFGMLRLLKDPMVQRNLRFIQALLTLMAERKGTPGCP